MKSFGVIVSALLSIVALAVAAGPVGATANPVQATVPEPVSTGSTYTYYNLAIDNSSTKSTYNSGGTPVTVNTTNSKPRISGYTQRGATVYVFVRSEEQAYVTKAGISDGYFQVDLTKALPNGTHEVYFQIAGGGDGNYSARTLAMKLNVAAGASNNASTSTGGGLLAQAGDFALPLFALGTMLVGAGAYIVRRRSA